MLCLFILKFVFFVSYIGKSFQNKINSSDSSNIINYIYQDENCQFNILSTTEDLNKNIKQCDDIILKELNKNEDKNIVNFHGKIYISSSIFEKVSHNKWSNEDTEKINNQISMILRNYRNKILSWDISDDLIYNESVKEWVEKLDANKPEVSKSPIILNEDNHYFNPYYNLLKNIIVIGNSIDKHITINYQQTINPSSFNYENDIQKLSIVYQMVHRLLEEMVPMNSLQFKFSFNLSSSSNEKEKEEEKEIISDSVFHFISNLKIFSNLKTNIDFLIPNNEKVRAIEFDRFIQICHKNSIKCQFSLVESIKNYKSIVSFNFYNNDYNSNMSSYFNSTLDIINSKIYKRDNFDSRSYNITFSMNDSEDSKVYEYNYDLYKLEDFPEFTYNDL